MKKKLEPLWQGVVTLVVCLIIWTIASKTGLFGRMEVERSELLFPPPNKVIQEFWSMITSGYLLSNIWTSLQRVLTGFAISVLIGTPIGIVMGMSKTIRNFLNPIFRFFAPIPGVAWVPLAILWFGLGNNAAIFIIVLGSISPIVVNTLQGVSDVDPALFDVMKIMEADHKQIIRYCIVPSVIPYLVSGYKLGLGFAWRVVIAAEMVGVPDGLGYVLSVGRNTANTAVTLIIIIVLGVIMILMEEVLFKFLERYTDNWRKRD